MTHLLHSWPCLGSRQGSIDCRLLQQVVRCVSVQNSNTLEETAQGLCCCQPAHPTPYYERMLLHDRKQGLLRTESNVLSTSSSTRGLYLHALLSQLLPSQQGV
jgi:hypothetical protein